MTVGYILLLGSVTIFGGAAVLAFWWAIRTGQMDNFDRNSRSIFAPDEPIGETTDMVLGTPPEKEWAD
ncbi:MAG TPA: cbb3-type cytochrome oxidase assembly protein CcoS [Gemmataceae bacterium]|jgi:cbb3-type cytochrome oxidase maturation protein|nr:cbb3-type cytochrome oxidase assembly protein CcoS [Gemmataceae bacterium]